MICGGHSGEVVPFDIIPFFRGRRASSARSSTTATRSRRCLELAARGLIKPLVYKTFPLEEARDAMATMERREHFGKIVLAPPDGHDGGRSMKRLGVDVGGTFTDLIYVDDEAGKILVHKVPTTPDDPSQGTVQGIRELTEQAGVSPSALDQVFHGTTIATNIVIEHNGARGRDDHDRGLPRHPPHRPAQEAAQLLELPGPALAGATRSSAAGTG